MLQVETMAFNLLKRLVYEDKHLCILIAGKEYLYYFFDGHDEHVPDLVSSHISIGAAASSSVNSAELSLDSI